MHQARALLTQGLWQRSRSVQYSQCQDPTHARGTMWDGESCPSLPGLLCSSSRRQSGETRAEVRGPPSPQAQL